MEQVNCSRLVVLLNLDKSWKGDCPPDLDLEKIREAWAPKPPSRVWVQNSGALVKTKIDSGCSSFIHPRMRYDIIYIISYNIIIYI
jgi:hypothetical protein